MRCQLAAVQDEVRWRGGVLRCVIRRDADFECFQKELSSFNTRLITFSTTKMRKTNKHTEKKNVSWYWFHHMAPVVDSGIVNSPICVCFNGVCVVFFLTKDIIWIIVIHIDLYSSL